MSTNEKGNISEAKALSRLVELGYNVSIPWGGKAHYDFIIEKDGVLETVQVKTGRLVNNDSAVSFNSTTQCMVEGKIIRTNYIDKVDRFVVYCPQTDELYTTLVKETPRRECLLRIKSLERKSNTTRWAKDFML